MKCPCTGNLQGLVVCVLHVQLPTLLHLARMMKRLCGLQRMSRYCDKSETIKGFCTRFLRANFCWFMSKFIVVRLNIQFGGTCKFARFCVGLAFEQQFSHSLVYIVIGWPLLIYFIRDVLKATFLWNYSLEALDFLTTL